MTTKRSRDVDDRPLVKKGKSRWLVGRVFPAEGPRLQVFESVFYGLLPHHLSDRHSWLVYSREHSPQSFPCVFEDWAGADDMFACLEGRGVVVGREAAGALVELLGLVLVLPYCESEVLPCGGVVSAHLGELGHEGAGDGLEPLIGFGLPESGKSALVGEGPETALGYSSFGFSEDSFLLVFQVVEVCVPFFEGKGVHLLECGGP